MSSSQHNSHSAHKGHMVHEGLRGIPEDQDFTDSQYPASLDDVDVSQSLASENVARWFQQDASTGEYAAEQKPQTKPRRRPPPGPDHVKHRRTRSGCYTCRARRVKCDEAHPTCERCRKGSRECNWPPEPVSKSAAGNSGKAVEAASDSSEAEDDDDDDDVTPKGETFASSSIKNRPSLTNFKTASNNKSRSMSNQKRSTVVTEPYIKNESMSPSTTDDLFSPSGHQSTVSTNTSFDDAAWSKLRPDEQFYLSWHQQSLSYCHYFLKQDSSRFIKSTLIEASLNYKPLLNAVVGFAAFHHALHNPGKKISTFLAYYNKGMSRLRKDLESAPKFTDAMIYTVLQLATFEEYMGDWANLMLHQRAACELIKTLYTPQSIMQSASSRVLFAWYVRMDIFVSMMSGSAPLIEVDWFFAYHQHAKSLATINPKNFDLQVEALLAEARIHGLSIASLLAKLPKGEISISEFHDQNARIAEGIETWAYRIHRLRALNSERLVYDFGNHRPRNNEDITDPFEPGIIFDAESFGANFLMMDSMSMQVTHKMQTATVLRQPPSSELTDLSLQQCQIYEAIQEYQGAPHGAFLSAQVNIGLVCLFVPRDDKHISWCRRMLSRFENNGYIYPSTFRAKVADAWAMPNVKDSWLADNSQQPQIIKDLRAFIQERTTKAPTQIGEDVRSLKAVLEKLNLEESPKNSPESMSSTSDAIISPVSRESVSRSWVDPGQNSWVSQEKHNQSFPRDDSWT